MLGVTKSEDLFLKARLVIACSIAVATFPVSAQQASSESYTLDYAVVGSATAVTTSVNQTYEIIGLVTTEGVTGGIAATLDTNYTISPLVGEAISEIASVNYWSLY